MKKQIIKKAVKILLIALILTFVFTEKTIVEKIDSTLKIKRSQAEQEKVKEEINQIINKGETNQEIALKVPFICQAPLQTEENWKLHEESCEEAALLQTYLYETGQTMSKEEANIEILKMIQWQKETLGGHFDLKLEQMLTFIKGYYGLLDENITVVENATVEDIREALNSQHPIIAPATSSLLNNPYYPYPGYHMLAITGLTKEYVITNDNGTRRGENYPYKIETFMTALKDGGGFIITLKIPQS